MMSAAKRVKAGSVGLLLLGLFMVMTSPGFAREKYETIDARIYGTGTQMGQNIAVQLIIYEVSTDADRQILVDAFMKGQNEGLVNALQKMPSVGRMSISGTVGSDVAFIRVIPTPTGRKVRFVTNRQIRMGEAWTDSNSKAFNLTAGEIDINEKDQGKSTGFVFPAAQLTIDKNGELVWELNQNAWRMAGIIDWNGPKAAK